MQALPKDVFANLPDDPTVVYAAQCCRLGLPHVHAGMDPVILTGACVGALPRPVP